jgi:hypothetical protein
MTRWWKRAETAAGLKAIPWLGWHGLRRKFATDRKDQPLKDLCHLGGWKNHNTVVSCYQKPEQEPMRAAPGSTASEGCQPTVGTDSEP